MRGRGRGEKGGRNPFWRRVASTPSTPFHALTERKAPCARQCFGQQGPLLQPARAARHHAKGCPLVHAQGERARPRHRHGRLLNQGHEVDVVVSSGNGPMPLLESCWRPVESADVHEVQCCTLSQSKAQQLMAVMKRGCVHACARGKLWRPLPPLGGTPPEAKPKPEPDLAPCAPFTLRVSIVLQVVVIENRHQLSGVLLAPLCFAGTNSRCFGSKAPSGSMLRGSGPNAYRPGPSAAAGPTPGAATAPQASCDCCRQMLLLGRRLLYHQCSEAVIAVSNARPSCCVCPCLQVSQPRTRSSGQQGARPCPGLHNSAVKAIYFVLGIGCSLCSRSGCPCMHDVALLPCGRHAVPSHRSAPPPRHAQATQRTWLPGSPDWVVIPEEEAQRSGPGLEAHAFQSSTPVSGTRHERRGAGSGAAPGSRHSAAEDVHVVYEGDIEGRNGIPSTSEPAGPLHESGHSFMDGAMLRRQRRKHRALGSGSTSNGNGSRVTHAGQPPADESHWQQQWQRDGGPALDSDGAWQDAASSSGVDSHNGSSASSGSGSSSVVTSSGRHAHVVGGGWSGGAGSPGVSSGAGASQQAWLARKLTADIKAAGSWQALAALVAEHGDGALNHIHVCALVTQAAKVVRFGALPPEQAEPFGAWYCGLLDLAYSRLPQAGPREVSNQLWAVARLGVHPGAEWLDAYLSASAGVLPGCASQEVGTLSWALAKFGHTPGRGAGGWLDAFLVHSAGVAGKLDGQALSNLLWGMATLGVPPVTGSGCAWADAVAGTLAVRAAHMAPQGLANALWALARLGVQPPRACLEACGDAAAAQAQGFKPGEASMLLHGCARLHYLPPAPLLATLQQRGAATMGVLSFAEAANMLWALAVLGEQPTGPWLTACLDQLAARAAQADGHTLASALHALARLQLQPLDAWWDAPLAQAGVLAGGMDAQSLATALLALAKLRMRPPAGTLAALIAACHQHMRPASAGSASGNGSMNGSSSGERSSDGGSGRGSSRPFNSQELANVAYAAVGLRAAPGAEWLASLEQAALAVLSHSAPQEVANLTLALSKLKHVPSEGYMAAVARYAEAHAARLAPLDREQLARAAQSLAAQRAQRTAAAAQAAAAPQPPPGASCEPPHGQQPQQPRPQQPAASAVAATDLPPAAIGRQRRPGSNGAAGWDGLICQQHPAVAAGAAQ